MMFLDDFYTIEGESIYISRQQASDFAKKIAGDFNPIHDVDAKRFCVPGDLLFALALNRYGLSQHMNVNFLSLVGENVRLRFPESDSSPITISDTDGKDYLSVEHSGETRHDPDLIQALTRHYVEFSGQTFPHILIPLMDQHQVMINPERPLVIYESMSINMERLDIKGLQLQLADSRLQVEGKRGMVCLEFKLISDGKVIGKGEKNMVLSGLRAFNQEIVAQLVKDYETRKQSYLP